MLSAIRQEVDRLILLNYCQQWVDPDTALRGLERYAERLIPGLIECLDDEDEEVRVYAVELLDAAGLRAEPALSVLVQLVSDPDQRVQVAAAATIAKFGTEAAAAIPGLEEWASDDREYFRLVALMTILRLDPTRRDTLLPIIQRAVNSGSPGVSDAATEFLAEYEAG